MIRHLAIAALLALGTNAASAATDIEGMWSPLKSKPVVETMPEAAAIPREIVPFTGDFAKGTIIVNTVERRLYLVLGDGKAMRYGIGVGRPGFSWTCRSTWLAARRTRSVPVRCISAIRCIASMARTNRNRSATRFPPAASACSTRT